MPNLQCSASPARLASVSIIAMAAVWIPSQVQAQAQVQVQVQVPPQMRGQAMALIQVCRGDYDRLCSGVTPGGGRILACLQAHAGQLSTACAQAMPSAEALKNSAVSSGVMPK